MRQHLSFREHFRRDNATGHDNCRCTAVTRDEIRACLSESDYTLSSARSTGCFAVIRQTATPPAGSARRWRGQYVFAGNGWRWVSLSALRLVLFTVRIELGYCGEVPERSNGTVSKTVVPLTGDRGFESLPLRHIHIRHHS
jgi:hypothetical protein